MKSPHIVFKGSFQNFLVFIGYVLIQLSARQYTGIDGDEK